MPSQLDLTIGAIEVGTIISCMLYGAVTVQLYTYSGRCHSDPWWLIIFVAGVWIGETFFTIISICYLYDVTISNFGNPLEIIAAPWTLCISMAFQGVIGSAVQSFFAYRVYKISRSLLWPLFAWLGSFARAAFTIALGALALKSGNIEEFSVKYGWAVITSLAVSLTVDVLNVGALTYYLSGRKGEFQHTARIIDRIIIYTIETGLVTSLTAICMVITRLAMPNNYVWLGLLAIYAKLYSNSLLVSLNARAGIKEKYSTNLNVTSSIGVTSTSVQRTDRGGISIQMVSFTEIGEPNQKQALREREDIDSTQELDISYKA